MRFPMLRQQADWGDSRPNRCLADYVAPAGDHVGAFAVAIHGADELAARLRGRARRLPGDHGQGARRPARRGIRRVAPPRGAARTGTRRTRAPTREELVARALPRDPAGLRLSRLPRPLREGAACSSCSTRARPGIELTETFAMTPGRRGQRPLLRAIRDSKYFAVGRIGRDQVEDYAARKGIALAEAERWLRPNLAYEPEAQELRPGRSVGLRPSLRLDLLGSARRLPAPLPRDAGLRRRHVSRRHRADRRRLRPHRLGTWVSALLIADFLPIILIGILLAPLVDRLSRRRLLIGSDLVRRGVFCALPFAGSATAIVVLAGDRGRGDRVLPACGLRGDAEPRRRRAAPRGELAAADGRESHLDDRTRRRRRGAHGRRPRARLLAQRRHVRPLRGAPGADPGPEAPGGHGREPGPLGRHR